MIRLRRRLDRFASLEERWRKIASTRTKDQAGQADDGGGQPRGVPRATCAVLFKPVIAGYVNGPLASPDEYDGPTLASVRPASLNRDHGPDDMDARPGRRHGGQQIRTHPR